MNIGNVIDFEFINEPTREFFNCTKRNQCLSGGYGSGKTYIACMKALFLCLSFNNYRMVIGRKEAKALRETTFRTFTKIAPESLYTFNSIEGLMTFKNGSQILWMHLDTANEKTLRGLEVNAGYLDQPEELEEQVFTTLNARIGRWDKAVPTKETLKACGYNSLTEWPRDEKTKNYIIPSYMFLTPNPDSELHWIWRKFHPDSVEARKNPDYAYFEVSSTENPKLPAENLKVMMANDPAWVSRFVHGKWGISAATIHIVSPQSRLRVKKDWIENLLQKSRLYRILDHGETSPTCCLWLAVYKNMHFYYREYYMADTVISTHRKNIADLSKGETYVCNWADPQIFKKTAQKYGGHWSVAEEYLDPRLETDLPGADPIPFLPADNNELSTRNRINEMLMLREEIRHPVTGAPFSPRLYFIDKWPEEHNYGVEHAVVQTRIARRIKLTEINGKPIYSDEREPAIEDHAYDCVRYGTASHAQSAPDSIPPPSSRSFLAARRARKTHLIVNSYGDRKQL